MLLWGGVDKALASHGACVWHPGFRPSCRVQDLVVGFRVQGLGFRV